MAVIRIAEAICLKIAVVFNFTKKQYAGLAAGVRYPLRSVGHNYMTG